MTAPYDSAAAARVLTEPPREAHPISVWVIAYRRGRREAVRFRRMDPSMPWYPQDAAMPFYRSYPNFPALRTVFGDIYAQPPLLGDE